MLAQLKGIVNVHEFLLSLYSNKVGEAPADTRLFDAGYSIRLMVSNITLFVIYEEGALMLVNCRFECCVVLLQNAIRRVKIDKVL